MKIDRLEALTLCFHYADGFTYAGGQCTGRLTTLVQVHTDAGTTGIGSAYSHPGLVHLVVEHLGQFLAGEDPADGEGLWKKMYRLTRWYGRKGAAMSALGAVDTALWDLRGKALGKPVWALLGGHEPSCPAYASALLWKDVEGLAAEAAALVERGFRRVKMRLGRDEDYDREAVRAGRRAIGTGCDVMVDGSMRYTLAAAQRLGEFLATQEVFWFEEPFEPEDLDSYTALRGKIAVSLAAGENEFGSQGFRELIRVGAVDVVQPDASRCGGITEVKRVAESARAAGLRFAPHSWSDAVAIVANAHVVAACDNGVTVEVDQTGNPFVTDLLAGPLEVTDGRLRLGNAPGLGIGLNADVIARYRLADPSKVPEGVYSDMTFGRCPADPGQV